MSPGLRASVRDFAFRHAGGTALVLIYHRVNDLDRDPEQLAVSPVRFDEQMRMLAENYHVAPLTDLVADVKRHHLVDRTVVVTFDDGYADNLLLAEPALTHNHVPATVFVSSGFVGADREFWWDEAERIALSPGSLPEHITLAAGDATFSATLDAQREYSTADADRDATWSVLADPSADGTRQRLYRELCAFLRPLPATARETALDQLRAQAGVSAAARPDNRPLTAEEVARLGASEMVAVGGHTVDHVVLSAQNAAEEQRQIALDRVGLASMLGTSPTMFSYPFGGLDDYSARTVDAVRQAGYAGACSNHPGVVKPWTDPYRIPRVLVRDWTADELHETLEGWFRDPR